MSTDVVLRTCLVFLAAIMLLTGLYTLSLRKMAGTYVFGMLAICGIVLPDWVFFDRPLSQWCTLLKVPSQSAAPRRMKLYPVRLIIYTAVYGYGFHKWWNFVTSH